MDSPDMILKQIEIGPMMNFVYLIGCTETREAAVVDPAWDPQAIINIVQSSNLRLNHILLTHGHPDHVNAVETLLGSTNAKVWIHRDELNEMRAAARDFGMPTGFMDHFAANFQLVSDGDRISIGKLSIQCLHTPGHSPGSQCFLIDGNLLSGDTLFVDACGRVDFPGGDSNKMWESLNRKLYALPDETVVYPGHDYGGRPTSTIGEQKRTNPYMRYPSVEQFMRDMG
jgi:hydroxyacylglutathione hydrolase